MTPPPLLFPCLFVAISFLSLLFEHEVRTERERKEKGGIWTRHLKKEEGAKTTAMAAAVTVMVLHSGGERKRT